MEVDLKVWLPFVKEQYDVTHMGVWYVILE